MTQVNYFESISSNHKYIHFMLHLEYFLLLLMTEHYNNSTNSLLYCDVAVEPAGLLIPMTIVVFISIIKDGIEDIKRHHADNRTNNRSSRIIRPDVSVLSLLMTCLSVCLCVEGAAPPVRAEART